MTLGVMISLIDDTILIQQRIITIWNTRKSKAAAIDMDVDIVSDT